MCTCSHGSDRHYLDYAGPGICGGVLTRCLEKDCGCKLFTRAFPEGTTVINAGTIINSGTILLPQPPPIV